MSDDQQIDEIRDDIEETRADMSRTIDQLEARCLGGPAHGAVGRQHLGPDQLEPLVSADLDQRRPPDVGTHR